MTESSLIHSKKQVLQAATLDNDQDESLSNPRRSRENRESVKESMIANDKLQGSFTIIVSIANAMMGPSVLLLPLQFIDVGLLTSTVVAFIIGLISYRTCDLTHLHTRLDEIEYLTAIQRIMGTAWNIIYFVNSVVILWMAGIIYFLSLCDVIYSAIQMAFNVTLPSEESVVFNAFSYQWTGIIIMACIGWLFFLPKLGKILDLTEKGVYCIITESLFLLYLGCKAFFSGDGVSFAFYSKDTTQEVAMVTSVPVTYAIGVFAMAFAIHNSIVAIVRKSSEPSKNSVNVFKAYVLTFVTYIVTGYFGAIGLYKKSGAGANTVLNNELYDIDETFTRILLVITQLATAFQLVTVLPVINNIVRNQIFIMIWGEAGIPPKGAFWGFNALYIVTFLIVQMFNISPNTVMSLAGAFIGFVIIYLLPVAIHFKALAQKQALEKKGYKSISDEGTSEASDIAEFLRKKQDINYVLEYGVHGLIMAVGVGIFIMQLVPLIEKLIHWIGSL